MGDSSYLQVNFQGGEVSPYMQGRADRPDYRESLNVCRNALPIEEGAWTRRSGMWLAAPTRKGVAGKLLAIDFSQGFPYNIELTDGHMRFYSGNQLVLENDFKIVAAISAASPAQITFNEPHGWSTGDEIEFSFPNGVVGPALNVALLINRQFEVTVVDDYNITLTDPVNGSDLNGALITQGGTTISAARVIDFVTPWTGTLWQDVWLVQDEDFALMLHPTTPTQQLTITQAPSLITGTPAGFNFEPAVFSDGPYLDPPTDASTLTPNALSGLVTLTVGYNGWSAETVYGLGDVVGYSGSVYQSLTDDNVNNEPDISGAEWALQTSGSVGVNGGLGFLSTDVGRLVRLFSEPAAWSPSTAYAVNATVAYGGNYYSAIAANTNQEPDTQINYWALSTTAALWTWGVIITVTNSAEIEVQLKGGPLLYILPILTYQVGVYGNTLGFPSQGAYLEGRFWLASTAVPNRLDSTMTNNGLYFSPTGPDGTVADDNGISAVLQATDVNSIFWLLPDQAGLILGTQAGEWTVTASALNDPITPTSIQARRVSRFGVENVQPTRAPLSHMFVQRYGRKLIEYVTDLYSGKHLGSNIALKGKHLTQSGLEEIAYVNELTPVVWARNGAGALIGCTYKRELAFGTQPPTFAGWHRHDLGSGRTVVSIQAGPAVTGEIDTLSAVTLDSGTGIYFVEIMAKLFDVDDTLLQANFLDESVIGSYSDIVPNGIRFYGFYNLMNYCTDQDISAYIGGLDCGGVFTIDSYGSITVPFGADSGGFLTQSYVTTLTAEADTFVGYASLVYGSSQPAGQIQVGLIGRFTGDGGEGAGQAGPDFTIYPDWDAGYVIIPNGENREFCKNSLFNGTVQFTIPTSTLIPNFNPAFTFTNSTNGQCLLGDDGYFYWPVGSDNSAPVAKLVAPPSAGFIAAMGNPKADHCGGSGNYTTTGNALASPGSIGGILVGGSSFMVCASNSDPFQQSQLDIIDGRTMTWVYHVDLALTQGVVSTRGPHATKNGFSTGTVFILEYVYPNGDLDHARTLPLLAVTCNSLAGQVWNAVSAPGVSVRTVAGLTPGGIIAGWTHWSAIQGLLYDETDGNLLAMFATDIPTTWSSGPTYDQYEVVTGSDGNDYSSIGPNNHGNDPTSSPGEWLLLGPASGYVAGTYLVKLSAATGDVIWAVSIPGIPAGANTIFQASRVRHGQLAIVFGPPSLGAPSSIVLFNTLTGATIATYSLPGVDAPGPSVYDDASGRLMTVPTSYDSSTEGAPQPMEGTPGTFANAWALFAGIPGAPTEYTIPAVFGYSYTSQGQLLRPLAPQETGAANGPALGKTRRTHQFSCLLANTGIADFSVGTDFSALYPTEFVSPGGIPYTTLQMWNGVYWDQLQDDSTFDSMPCWQITRPLPATVLAFEAFIHTQDR